jgi:hypothetical protein
MGRGLIRRLLERGRRRRRRRRGRRRRIGGKVVTQARKAEEMAREDLEIFAMNARPRTGRKGRSQKRWCWVRCNI